MKDFLKKIQKDMVISMRLKEKIKVNVLKSLVSDVNYSIKSSTPSTPMDILLKSIKKRSDALEEFKKADRQDLAQNEELELQVLNKYLDRKKTEAEIIPIIHKVVRENPGISTSSRGPDFGRLMTILKEELNAAEAPRGPLSKLVKDQIKIINGQKNNVL
jgi:uncharacterized protein YqeY